MNRPPQPNSLVDEGRNIVAHVEDQPDGDEPGDAVDIRLEEITNNVAIEQLHGFSKRLGDGQFTQRDQFCTFLGQKLQIPSVKLARRRSYMFGY